ncbi:methyl-accepting chemotaxis protein [Paenibacillus sp. FSL R5-0887]|jgi:methyl-accepting chemotaxis protein|uniref:methyl-accepting chemotaxis protein n=1 Tax=Paenibacillus sp. FSL R5-0887 TaxID=2921662 RepID=UPI0030F726E6
MKSQVKKEKAHFQLHPAKSIGVRLFLIFFISTMVLVLSLGYISYSVAEQTIENNALSANQQTVVQAAEKFDVELLRYEDGLGRILYNSEIQDALKQGNNPTTSNEERNLQSNQISAELNAWLTASKGVEAVYLIPMNQEVPTSSAGSKDSAFIKEFRESSWFKQLEEQPQTLWIPRTEQGQAGNTSGMFHLAQSIAGDTQSPGYIIICDIRISELENQLRKVDLGPSSYMQLLTDKDELIASSQQVGTDTYLSLGGTLLHGLEHEAGSLPTKDEKGKSILAVYGTMESSSWRLLGVVPAENLTKDALRILKTTYIIVAVAAIVAILIGYWMYRMVSKPLTRLKDLMSQGADGNLGVRTDITSRDEIGQLSGSFNRMMERITELVIHTNETARKVMETADELSRVSRKTAMAAKEIAAATEEIAGGSGSLALEADQGNELTGQISVQMNKVNSATHEMDHTAHSIGVLSEEGFNELKELLGKTNKTGDMTNKLVLKVNELQDTTSSVMKVLDVMQNITQQTNILSLNATIEAARAGESGRGFMVVADEIRQLADQSKESIAVVANITDTIMKDMNETVGVLSEVAPLFNQQVTSVESTSDIFVSVQDQMRHFITRLESVALSMDSLSQSQKVLSNSMGNISSIAEESSAASQEVASLSGEQQSVSDHLVELSEQLEHASRQLQEKLSKFNL